MRLLTFLVVILLPVTILSQSKSNTNNNKFKQLKEELATPNVFHNAAGAPGHLYWQQRADYRMDIRLDDENQRIYGVETITYYNNSPDALEYLWLQLDQNVRARNSDHYLTAATSVEDSVTFGYLKALLVDFDGGFKIEAVTSSSGKKLPYTINKTMMRVDLPRPLEAGAVTKLNIEWWYNINDRIDMGGRSGYEYFAVDDNYLYTIAQFFPRMCVYDAVEGWQNKQFLWRGEFTLTFGDYDVKLTVPADHMVGATGVLQNPSAVLTNAERRRLNQAKTAAQPIMIRTAEEALDNEKSRAKSTRTWHYKAENVRDFAFVSSRKFIWDAIGVPMGGKTVMAMSYYPREGNPLWEKYSTRSVAHTLRVYSRYTFDYPYPVAISVHTDRIGMEYPMISFNGRRPEPDGTYTERTKYGLISVIIHEVGHNYFPMIVSSDERQWTWMDEGLNSFLQYLTEQEWQRDYPSRRGPAYKIVDYMKGDKSNIAPIMTNSESIFQFGNNAYGKPAAALNILRETILGRDLFDYAFKTYSQRWMFKHPTPADFFRTMEDASGTDLDWFWRGWFYTTDHVDISLDAVELFQIDTRDPKREKDFKRKRYQERPLTMDQRRNAKTISQTELEKDSTIADFYNDYDRFAVDAIDHQDYEDYLAKLDEDDRVLLETDKNFYQMSFTNHGGLVMPIILKIEFSDGSIEGQRIPSEIWRYNSEEISKVLVTDKEIVAVTLDPNLETADTDRSNNFWPPRTVPNRFRLFKEKSRLKKENPMQRDRRAKERSVEPN